MSSVIFVPAPAARANLRASIPRDIEGVRVPNQVRRLVRQLRSATRGWSRRATIPLGWRANESLGNLVNAAGKADLDRPNLGRARRDVHEILAFMITPPGSPVRAGSLHVVYTDRETLEFMGGEPAWLNYHWRHRSQP